MQKPEVTAFFDEPTNTASYVVVDPATQRCALVDSVLDYDQASGHMDHRSADLFGDGETDAHCRVRILAVADQQNEAWSGRALAGVRGEEIRALFKCD